jgi:deoxyadenosine/deoxycytidine kinase
VASAVSYAVAGGFMSGKLFIAIAGNIGTGKTTLTKMLADHYGWKPHFESVSDNPYLKDFYSDMPRWSFPLQVYFLNHRFKTHKSVGESSYSAIQDRSIYEDCHIFARNLFESGKMEERDYRNYLDLYGEMIKYLPPPDLMIYLRKSVSKLEEQIKRRGSDFEQSIPVDYLKCLNGHYEEWIGSYKIGPLLVIDSNELDFVANPEHFDQIARKILEKLDQRELFLPLAGMAKASGNR